MGSSLTIRQQWLHKVEECPVGAGGQPTASCIGSDQKLDLTSAHVALGTLWAGLLLPHRPWQMKPTHQNKEWLSTVPPLCITTASVNVILKMLQHYSDCKELVLFAITAKNGSCLELVASLFSATNGCAARRPGADP